MSSIPRIYQPFSFTDKEFNLDERAAHYLINVLRLTAGESITLFNGFGGEYEALIIHIAKKNIRVRIVNFLEREVESHLNITLAQSMAKGEKMDVIIQKAVELGVKKIVPLFTERCTVKLQNEKSEKRLLHWRSIIVSACEQSGRNVLPEISPILTLKNWLPTIKADQCFVLTPHESQKISLLNSHQNIVLLIGPEGGLTENEIKLAKTHHFIPLNLGPRILRTETASLAALAILQYQLGDLA
jgi:16S rRNA (uracil1498-N3)-methyltransferase